MAALVDTNILVHFGLAELWSEDFQHDRLYGTVRVINPLLASVS